MDHKHLYIYSVINSPQLHTSLINLNSLAYLLQAVHIMICTQAFWVMHQEPMLFFSSPPPTIPPPPRVNGLQFIQRSLVSKKCENDPAITKLGQLLKP